MYAEKLEFSCKTVQGKSKKEMIEKAKLTSTQFLLYFNESENCYEVLDNNTYFEEV